MSTELSGELPRLVSEMHIAPFEQGRADVECFLVETRESAFLVNEKMRCLLEALGEQSSMAGLRAQLEARLGQSIDEAEVSAAIAGLPRVVFQEGGSPARKTPFHFSFRLLPARAVQTLAGWLRRLYSPAIVTAVVGLLIFELPWLWQDLARCADTRLGPSDILWLIAGTGLIALVHELGHAAAGAWYGLRPGEIGFGLYLVFPAFYTDVTRAWRLPPSRRAIVDVGGIYFQLILIVLAVPVAHARGNDGRIFAFVLSNLYLIFHNLNPLFKMDGYWIFSDLAGLPNLHKRTWRIFRRVLARGDRSRPGIAWTEGRRTLLLLHGYALAVLVYGVFALAALPRWFAAQLRPYPMIAATHLRSIVADWRMADYKSLGGEIGGLAMASLMPALVVALVLAVAIRLGARWVSRRKVI